MLVQCARVVLCYFTTLESHVSTSAVKIWNNSITAKISFLPNFCSPPFSFLFSLTIVKRHIGKIQLLLVVLRGNWFWVYPPLNQRKAETGYIEGHEVMVTRTTMGESPKANLQGKSLMDLVSWMEASVLKKNLSSSTRDYKRRRRPAAARKELILIVTIAFCLISKWAVCIVYLSPLRFNVETNYFFYLHCLRTECEIFLA